MTKAHDRLLERVRAAAAALEDAAYDRDNAIIAAVFNGCTQAAIAEAAGLTQARVSQIAPRPRAQEPAPEPVSVSGDDTVSHAQEKTLPPDAPLVSTFATTRVAPHYARRVTAWVGPVPPSGWQLVTDGAVPSRWFGDGSPVRAADLLVAIPDDVTRVYVTGHRGAVTDEDAETLAEGVRAWFLGELPAGWRVSDKGHYLADPDLPVGRFRFDADGREVEVHRAATWLGEGDYTPHLARDAMALLSSLLRTAFGTPTWLSTPSTTGRDLWRRSIPKDREWPVLSPELRELIQSTSGQGRMELLPWPGMGRRSGRLGDPETGTPAGPGFVYLDGRFMYAALTWGMPVGAPAWHTRAAIEVREGDGHDALLERGRWLARVTVPKDWAHVGIVPLMAAGGGWEYPREPGRRFETWADAVELHLARQQGWRVELLEGFTFDEGKPLDTWTKKLVTMREQVAGEAARLEYDPSLVPLVRGAIRSMLLFAIGAFAGRTHLVTKAGVYPGTGATRDGVRDVNGVAVWQEAGSAAWSEAMAHPEWSAQIWARARVRLLDGPGLGRALEPHEIDQWGKPMRTGALHVPFADVIAFRTDALYLTADPRWADDGRPGRFRVKGQLGRPVPWPADYAALFALRDQAEAAS